MQIQEESDQNQHDSNNQNRNSTVTSPNLMYPMKYQAEQQTANDERTGAAVHGARSSVPVGHTIGSSSKRLLSYRASYSQENKSPPNKKTYASTKQNSALK